MTAAAIVTAGEEAAAPARPALAGYVEARTRDRIVGWAWDPASPAARQMVALVAGGDVVARTLADQHREDLARNGIGDGAHAFTFLLDDAMRARGEGLDVAVIGEGGSLVRLPSAGAEAAPPQFLQVQRGLAAIAAGQRALLKAVQAPPGRAEEADRIAAIVAQQERIEKAVDALEIFVMRLDERLAALQGDAARPRASRGLLAAAAICALGGAAAIAWALSPAFG